MSEALSLCTSDLLHRMRQENGLCWLTVPELPLLAWRSRIFRGHQPPDADPANWLVHVPGSLAICRPANTCKDLTQACCRRARPARCLRAVYLGSVDSYKHHVLPFLVVELDSLFWVTSFLSINISMFFTFYMAATAVASSLLTSLTAAHPTHTTTHNATYHINYTTVTGYFLQDESSTNATAFDFYKGQFWPHQQNISVRSHFQSQAWRYAMASLCSPSCRAQQRRTRKC